jgi:hypothetical protein
MYVKALNKMGIGFYYRVKNMGTYDPIKRIYRKHGDMVAIPDICGYKKTSRAVFIECKNVTGVEKKKKLIFSVKITAEQCQFLETAHRMGCLAGVAFNLDDCISISMDDPTQYPRHPRTYSFLPLKEREIYAEKYAKERKAVAIRNQDPLGFLTSKG